MKVACLCCTWCRPKLLGYLIRCFEKQEYPNRELIILDDAGQYGNQSGDRWRIVSVKARFPSLADKRNETIRLAADADAYAIWDDDDMYLPWALSASVAALQLAEWSRPSVALMPEMHNGLWTFKPCLTGGMFHGGWAFRRSAIEKVGGYTPGMSGPEDKDLRIRLEVAGVSQCDPLIIGWRPPFYIYTNALSNSPHISGLLTGRDNGEDAWRRMGMLSSEPCEVVPTDPPFDLSDRYLRFGVYPRPF